MDGIIGQREIKFSGLSLEKNWGPIIGKKMSKEMFGLENGEYEDLLMRELICDSVSEC